MFRVLVTLNHASPRWGVGLVSLRYSNHGEYHSLEGEHETPRSVTGDQRPIFDVALLMDSNDSFDTQNSEERRAE
jgi:hypothetical protein